MDTIAYIKTAADLLEMAQKQIDGGFATTANNTVLLSIAASLIAIAGSINSIDGSVENINNVQNMIQGI